MLSFRFRHFALIFLWMTMVPGIAGASTSFEEVDRLVQDQKWQEALKELDKNQDGVTAPDVTVQTDVRRWNILWGLGRHQEVLRLVMAEPSVKEPVWQAVMSLYRGYFLQAYVAIYDWEIRSRPDTVGGDAADVKTWSRPRFRQEILKALSQSWTEREALGRVKVNTLDGLLKPGTYPAPLMPSLRDKVSLALAQAMASSADWTPAEANAVASLPWGSYGGPATMAPKDWRPDTAKEHPLAVASVVLKDAEAAHHRADEASLALEMRLRLWEMLYIGMAGDEERAHWREQLLRVCDEQRRDPWAGRCFFLAASWFESADDLVRAHDIAQRAATDYPKSYGGQAAAQLLARVEEPDYRVTAMAQDEPGKNTLSVSYRNLTGLYFRAYRRGDLRAALEQKGEEAFHASPGEVKELLKTAPAAAWQASLVATTDFKHRQADLALPLKDKAYYTIVASSTPDFAGIVMSNDVLLTGLMLAGNGGEDGSSSLTLRAMASVNGAPMADTQYQLYFMPWRKKPEKVAAVTADSKGLGTLPFKPRSNGQWLILATRGDDVAFYHPEAYAHTPSPATTEALFTTDRALYRPGQELFWQTVVFDRGADRGLPVLAKKHSLTVILLDGNGKLVAKQAVTTDAYGVAHGTFHLPSDRLLGNWTLRGEGAKGTRTVRVEAYKRPGFEITLTPPEDAGALRFHQEIPLTIKAAYLFGGELRDGKVTWTIKRQARMNSYAALRRGKAKRGGWRPGPMATEEVVASGSGKTDKDGRLIVRWTPQVDEKWLQENPGLSYDYEWEVHVMDAGGESQEASCWLTVSRESLAPILTAVKPFFTPGEAIAVDIARQDPQGKPQAGHGRWRLLRLTPPQVPHLPSEIRAAGEDEGSPLGSRQRWERDFQPERDWQDWREGEEVAQGPMEHPRPENARWEHGPLPVGVYRLIYTTTDKDGESTSRDHDLVVADARAPVALPLYLWLDKTTAKAGEEVTLLWGSGFKGQALYLDVVRGENAVERRLLKGTHGMERLRVALKDRGGLSFRLYSARAHEFMQVEKRLQVPFAEKALKTVVTHFRSPLTPGASETWEIAVSGADGKPALARILLLMHDQSLDALQTYEPAALGSAFPALGYVRPLYVSVAAQYPTWIHSLVRTALSVEVPEESSLALVDAQGFGGLGMYQNGHVAFSRMSEALPATKSRAADAPMAPSHGIMAEQAPAADATASPSETRRGENPPRVPEQFRRDFSETALWRPTLLSDRQGHLSVTFKVSSSLTRWRVYLQALTADFRYGEWEQQTVTSREWSVRPQLPRLWREGDVLRLRTLVRNDADQPHTVSVQVVVHEAASGKDVTASLVGKGASGQVTVPAKGEQVWESVLTAPVAAGTDYLVKVSAAGDGVSDGEERVLPLLPGRFHVTASRHAVLHDAETAKMTFEGLSSERDPTLVPDALVVSAQTDLWLSLLKAVPALLDNPYQTADAWAARWQALALMQDLFQKEPELKKEVARWAKRRTPLPAFVDDPERRQLAALETPWLAASLGEDAAWAPYASLLEPEGLGEAQRLALARIAELQNPDGGFVWCPGGESHVYMTLSVLSALARAAESGASLPRSLVERGLRYLQQQALPDWRREGQQVNLENPILFLAVVEALKKAGGAGAALAPETDMTALREVAWTRRAELRPYLKSLFAMALMREGRDKEARSVFAPVMDQAKQDPKLGVYWAPEDQTWVWYEDTVEGHATALRTLAALDAKDGRLPGLVQWLLAQKKWQQWRSAHTTVEVLYSLRAYLQARGETLAPKGHLTLAVTGGPRETFPLPTTTDRSPRLVLNGSAVPTQPAPQVTASKDTRGLAFVDATYAFSTTRLDLMPWSDHLGITRQVFVRDMAGTRRLLGDAETLRVGDELEIELAVNAKAAMDFVVIKDPRPTGFEPLERLSGRGWEGGMGWYREVRDEATRFFLDRLPKGRFVVRYRLRSTTAGQLRYEPATVQSFFAPEVSAYGKGRLLVVEGAPS